MSDLAFEVEWEDPGGVSGPELRATWARLAIRVGDERVTEVFDQRARTVRDAIYLPLYPLAEWLVDNWWSLLFEVETPGRSTAASYPRRHSLAAAREGYALPDLTVVPTGEAVQLEWRPQALPQCRVRFLAQGRAQLPLPQFRRRLTDFVELVLGRLHECGVGESHLASEWQAIAATDAEEAEFCQAAAALGLDPYDLDGATTDLILQASEALPPSLEADFFAAAEPRDLGEACRGLVADLERLQALRNAASPLPQLKRKLGAWDGSGPPWEQGYDLARRLRQALGAEREVFPNAASLYRLFGLDEGTEGGILTDGAAPRCYEALVAVNQADAPGFLLCKRLDASRKFAFCRALLEYLHDGGGPARMVTRANSGAQQRNRAFAAEFLTPAALLRERISGPTIEDDEIQELADHFGVSPMVVGHQLANHRLAEVIATDPKWV